MSLSHYHSVFLEQEVRGEGGKGREGGKGGEGEGEGRKGGREGGGRRRGRP